MSKVVGIMIWGLFSGLILSAQDIVWETLAPMPERVTNNAVTGATVNGVPYVYSFSGLDSTKSCLGDHLRSFRYNTVTNEWETIAPLPDPIGGKIAAGASTVKNKIYIIGGYHLEANGNVCNEISSSVVHIYDPETNSYLPDGATLIKAIDDQVQAVWRDSLIYVISGWSNTSNVRDVQIYNPTDDQWMNGTTLPSIPNWRVFGASGIIIQDTIYYIGGAGNWNGSNFPPTLYFRKGYINPENPSEISWTNNLDPTSKGYRMGAAEFEGKGLWIGGADISYNFDGIAYNGSGGVPPLDRITIYDPDINDLQQISGFIPAVMDLRGMAKISDNEFIIAGGMLEDQQVSDQTYLIRIDALTGIEEAKETSLRLFPNPVKDQLHIIGEGPSDVELLDIYGRLVLNREISGNTTIDLSHIAPGIYYLRASKDDVLMGMKKLVLQR